MGRSQNPFNETLDWALQGKRVRVRTEERTYEGWVERVHHSRGSVVMHDVTAADGEELGSVFVRDPGTVEVLEPRKRIEYRRLDELRGFPGYYRRFPGYDRDVSPRDDVVRRAFREQYAGSFPVVRENGTIINGHKRIIAAYIAGLERHPVEVIDVTDGQAWELFNIAHPELFDDDPLDGFVFYLGGVEAFDIFRLMNFIGATAAEYTTGVFEGETTHVVAGESIDDRFLELADEYGIDVIDVSDFRKLLNERGLDNWLDYLEFDRGNE